MDFTSALYLGLRHPSESLPQWSQLSSGVPAALRDPPGARQVAQRLAALQRVEAAVLAASTLHAIWDLVGVLARRGSTFLVDADAYAVAQWGAERARALGSRVVLVPHHDAAAAARAVRSLGRGAGRPVIIVDGFCPTCGEAAPVGALGALAREHDGIVVCDDTQALGVLGARPSAAFPLGRGGGGTAAWTAAATSHVVTVASLAKAFGVPIAAISGSGAFVEEFTELSETRAHCSPPSAAAIAAADRALTINARCGDALRRKLMATIARFRESLEAQGVACAAASMFPVQSVGPLDRERARVLHDQLSSHGVRTVLQSGRCRKGAYVTFLLTARHDAHEITRAATLVAGALRGDGTLFFAGS